MARAVWTLIRPLFRKMSRSILTSLWQSCVLETLVLPVCRYFGWLADIIKNGFTPLRRQYDSSAAFANNAAAGLLDEANDSTPEEECDSTLEEDCVATEVKTTSAYWTPPDTKPNPGVSQESEVDFQQCTYRNTTRSEASVDRLKAIHESPQECSVSSRSRRAYRRRNAAASRRGASVKPAYRGKQLSEESGEPEVPLKPEGVHLRRFARMANSTTFLCSPSEGNDAGELVMRRGSKVTCDELAPEEGTLQSFQVAHRRCENSVVLPSTDVLQPFEPQNAGCVADKLTRVVSGAKKRPSNYWTKPKEPNETYPRFGKSAARNPAYVLAETSTLSEEEMRMPRPASSRIFTGTLRTSKLKPKFSQRGSRRTGRGNDLLAGASFYGQVGWHQSFGSECQFSSTLMAETTPSEGIQQQSSIGSYFMKLSSPEETSSQTVNSRRQMSNRVRFTPRDLPKTSGLTGAHDNDVEKESDVMNKNLRSSWKPKRQGRSQYNGAHQESGRQARLRRRNSLKNDAGTTSRTGLRQVTPDIETTYMKKPPREPKAAPGDRANRRFNQNENQPQEEYKQDADSTKGDVRTNAVLRRRRSVGFRDRVFSSSRTPGTKLLPRTYQENPSAGARVRKGHRFIKGEPPSSTSKAVPKEPAVNEGNPLLSDPSFEGASRRPALHPTGSRFWYRDKNMNSQPRRHAGRMSVTFSASGNASLHRSTGFELQTTSLGSCSTQAEETTTRDPQRRRRHSKYTKHTEEPRKQQLWNFERTAIRTSSDVTVESSLPDGPKFSLASTTNGGKSSRTSGAPTAISAPEDLEPSDVAENLPDQPIAAKRAATPTRRTLLLPSLDGTLCGCSGTFPCPRYFVALSCSCSRISPCKSFAAPACSFPTTLSSSCFELHDESAQMRTVAPIKGTEMAMRLNLPCGHEALLWPLGRKSRRDRNAEEAKLCATVAFLLPDNSENL